MSDFSSSLGIIEKSKLCSFDLHFVHFWRVVFEWIVNKGFNEKPFLPRLPEKITTPAFSFPLGIVKSFRIFLIVQVMTRRRLRSLKLPTAGSQLETRRCPSPVPRSISSSLEIFSRNRVFRAGKVNAHLAIIERFLKFSI
jgi:hypothetical protein